MRALKKTCIAALLCYNALFTAQSASADLVAVSGEQTFITLKPMANGLSSVTLAWPLARLSAQKLLALRSGLVAVMGAGTEDLSPYEAKSHRSLNGLNFEVTSDGANLMLTATSPTTTFPALIAHLEDVLSTKDFPIERYKRELIRLQPQIVTKNRRPKDVMAVLAHNIALPSEELDEPLENFEFSFGRPKQVIMRSPDTAHKPLVETFLKDLPLRSSGAVAQLWRKLSLVEVATKLNQLEDPDFTLPKGVIHLNDPSSTEMMIVLVQAQTFEDEVAQVSANLLMNYIGAHQGSEMFRIIRQELRAAYNPSSFFETAGKNKALMALSATVAAEEWPELLEQIKEIYENVRMGDISKAGLETVKDRLARRYSHSFATNPVWTAHNLLREYPIKVEGEIRLPVFSAVVEFDVASIIDSPDEHLPLIEDYLVILVGGGAEPSEELRKNGYCALTPSQPLSHCLDVLKGAKP
ncbi:insulinase family protein [Planktotalea sp.]|uniref:insulinase family protein n=1 Tax=Planktotalea sp. TaxID=2029877 RepID=UPI003299F834